MSITATSADGIQHIFPDETDQGVIDFAMKRYAINNLPRDVTSNSDIHDSWFTDSAPGRILNAFGQGVAQNWGSPGISPDLEKALSDVGVFNDYQKGEHSTFKSWNEAWMRPSATALQTLFLGIPALFGGVTGAIRQAGVETGAQAVTEPIAALPEVLPSVVGVIPEIGPALGAATRYLLRPTLPPLLAAAEETKVIGEGEAGWKGTAPKPPPAELPGMYDPLPREPVQPTLPFNRAEFAKSRTPPKLTDINNGNDFVTATRDATPPGSPMRPSGPLTQGELFDLADELGVEPSSINRNAVGDLFNSDELLTAARLVNESSEALPALMERARTGGPADIARFIEARDRHLLLMEQLKGATDRVVEKPPITGPGEGATVAAEAAGGGRRLRVETRVGGLEEGPSRETGAAPRVLMPEAEKKAKTVAEEGRTMGTPQQTNKFIGDSEKPGFMDKVIEYRTNGLISGPATHGEYIIGNHLLALGRAILEAPIAGLVGAIRRTVFGGEGGARFSEAYGQLYGFTRGQISGVQAAGQAWKAKGTIQLPGEADSPLFGPQRGAIQGPLGEAVRTPSRAIGAIHSYHRQVGYSQWINGIAYREAANEGLTGSAFNARVAELTMNPTEAMMAEAVQQSTNQVLMGRGGVVLNGLTQLANSSPFARLLVPFIRISGNVLRQTFLERTPMGLIDGEIRANLSGRNGAVARDQQIAKQLWTPAVAGTVIFLKHQGVLTGDLSEDPGERAMQQEAGMQPYAVRIGDSWISYRRLGVLGLLLGTFSDAYDAVMDMSKADSRKTAGHLFAALSKGILNETWMRDISDMVKAIYDWDRYGNRFVGNFLGSFVPFSVAQQQLNRVIDPDLREARTIIDNAKTHVLGLSQTLLPKVGPWGQDIPNVQSLTPGLTAMYQSHHNNDPVTQTLLGLGEFPAPVERTIRGVTLSDAQHTQFARLAGQMAKEQLDELVNQPWLREMSPGMQAEVLRRTWTVAHGAAADLMLLQYPNIINSAMGAKMAVITGGPLRKPIPQVEAR